YCCVTFTAPRYRSNRTANPSLDLLRPPWRGTGSVAMAQGATSGLRRLFDLATGSDDRRAGAGRGQQALDHQLLRYLALLDDLGLLGRRRDQLGGAQGGEVDVALELVELVQHHLHGVALDLGT